MEQGEQVSKAKTAQLVEQATDERIRAAREARREVMLQAKRAAQRASIRRNTEEIGKGKLTYRPFASLWR